MTDTGPDLSAYFDETERETVTSDAAAQAASTRRLIYGAYAAKGENYYTKLMEEDFPVIYEELTSRPNSKNKLSAWSEGRLADAIVGLYYSSNADGTNDVQAQQLAQNLYDILGDRIDPHLNVYNQTISGELKAGKGGRPDKGFWKQVLGGVVNVADYLDIGWEKVGAPLIGNTLGTVERGLSGAGWSFKSTGELDTDGDGRASFFEAIGAAKPAEGWAAKAVDIGGEIVFDPLSWLTFGVSATGRAGLGAIGKGMNLAKIPADEIAELGSKIAANGMKGLNKVDLDNAVKYGLSSHLEDSKRLIDKYGSLAEKPRFAASLENLSVKNIDDAIAEAPEYMQASLRKAVDDVLAAGDLPENMVAYGLQKMPRQLKGLDRSAKSGPRFAGKSIPLWRQGATLGGNSFTKHFFNPQTVRLMGGESSPAYKAAMHFLPNWRPRSYLAQTYSGQAVRRFKEYSRRAYQDVQWQIFNGRNLEVGIGGARRIQLARKAATQIRTPDNQPAIRFVNQGHKPELVAKKLRRFAGDSDSPYKDFKDVESIVRYSKGELALDDTKVARLEEVYGPADTWDVEKHSAYMDDLMETWRHEDNLRYFDEDFLEAELPWGEYKARYVQGFKEKASPGDLRKLVNDGEITFLTDDVVLKSVEESTLLSPRVADVQRSAVGRSKQVLAGMQFLWSASALALTKGTTTIGTNVIGALNTAMMVGLQPHMLARNMGRTARLMKLQRGAQSRIKATTALKQHFEELTGHKIKKDDELDSLRQLLNDKISVATGPKQEAMMVLRNQIKHLDEQDLRETSFIWALGKEGASSDEVVDLLAMGEFGLLSSSRTRDVLNVGEDVTSDGTPMWRTIDSNASGVKGYAKKLLKGDFETITKTLTLGSHVPTQMFEDWMRGLSFLTARDMGASWDEAWELVAKSQFDYQDLTLKEANFKANWSRFYTYPRKAMGLMAESLTADTGRLISSTRAMFDSIKYLHDVTISDDGAYAEFLMPGWLERRPGVFQVNGVAGVVRLPLFEWAEMMQSVFALPHAVIPSQDTGLLSSKYLTDSSEAARQILGQISGFVPEAIKHTIEVATGRDSYSGRSLDPDEQTDWYLRAAGIPLPGIAQGVNNLRRGIEVSKDDDYGDRAAKIRLFSAIISIWERGAEEVDAWALSELNAEAQEAISEMNDNGVDTQVATIADLVEADVVEPQTVTRLRLYGEILEEDHPDFDPKKSRHLQRRMVTEQEWVDRLAAPYAEKLGLQQSVPPESLNLTNEDYRVAVQRAISKDILDVYTDEDFADYLVRIGVGNRENQRALGVSPMPLPQDNAVVSPEEQQAEALEELRRGGFSLEQAQVLSPYLNNTVLKYQQLLANGVERNLARYELMEGVNPMARNLLEPGFVPEVQVTGVPYTVDELEDFAARARDLADEIEFLYPVNDWDAEFIARVVLMKGSEQVALFGASLPSGRVSVDTGINRELLAFVKAQQRVLY